MSAMDKCYGAIPPDGSTPSDLIEVNQEISNSTEQSVNIIVLKMHNLFYA